MSQSTSPSTDRDLDRLDLEEIKRFLARRWIMILSTALSCLILAGAVCVAVTPVYTATSQILLDPRRQHIFGQDGVSQDSSLDSSIVDSQIPIILSTRLLAKVVAKENLVSDAEFGGVAKEGMLTRLLDIFRPAKVARVDTPSLDGIDPKLAPVVLHLFDKIDVTRVGKSYVLSLSVSSRDPAKAMRLANSLAQTYVEDQIDVHAKSVQQAAAFFEDRLGNLRDQVRESERAVADFRKSHDLTTTTMDGKITVGEQQLQNLNEKLATTSADTAEKLAKYQQAMRFQASDTNLDTLPEIIRSPVISNLRQQQADLTRREADLSAMYGPSYPAITQIHAQRTGLDRAIGAEMRRLASTLRNDYEVAKAREDSMRKTIGALTDVSGGDNEVGVKLRELERTNLANKALFENFLNRAKLTQEQSTFEEPDARLISPALEPSTPSSPKTKIILPVAAIAGLLFGLGLAVILDILRKKDGGGLKRVAAKPVPRADAFILGRVPDVGGRRGKPVNCAAYMSESPGSPFARAVEAIAAKIMPSGGGGRTLTLAPLAPGEGATSLAICLAAACGAAGRKVLLIDADPSRRGLSAAMRLADAPGLAEVLAGEASANKAIIRRPLFGVMPIGSISFDPAVSAERLRAFLAEARSRFDLVLVDAPAFAVGADNRVNETDVLLLGQVSDGVVLVASWDQLLRDAFIAAVDAIADQPNFSGIILNRTAVAAEEDLARAG